jgi:hypothetical protein
MIFRVNRIKNKNLANFLFLLFYPYGPDTPHLKIKYSKEFAFGVCNERAQIANDEEKKKSNGIGKI